MMKARTSDLEKIKMGKIMFSLPKYRIQSTLKFCCCSMAPIQVDVIVYLLTSVGQNDFED
jgi:hypothetical protein